jgi:serine/threonine protein kinase
MNRYQVLGVVGEGAYGVVLKCRNKQTNEMVAIKKFKDSDDDEQVRRTTLREVRILKSLSMPHIVKLFDAFRRKGKIYLVFEYVDYNLLDLLERNVLGMAHERIRSLTYQLLKALLYCHHRNILHRDVKPENLLVTTNDQLKLCDFGFARSIPSRMRAITRYVATRWYRAPELLLQSGVYGKGVDMWAVGCIMGEMYTGRPMFPGDSDIDQLHIVQRQIGPLTREQRGLFNEKEEFEGLTLSEDTSSPSKGPSLSQRYDSSMPPDALDLMVWLLKMDERERPSAEEALRHEYFDDIREEPLLATDGGLAADDHTDAGRLGGVKSRPKRDTSVLSLAAVQQNLLQLSPVMKSESDTRDPFTQRSVVADLMANARSNVRRTPSHEAISRTAQQTQSSIPRKAHSPKALPDLFDSSAAGSKVETSKQSSDPQLPQLVRS